MVLRRLVTLLLVLFVALGAVACGGGDEKKPPPGPTVSMEASVKVFNDKFDPAEVKIGVNGKVTFKNVAPIEYHLHVDGLFNTVLKPGMEHTQEFPAKGTWRVYDTISPAKPEMTVIVEGAEGDPAEAEVPKSK